MPENRYGWEIEMRRPGFDERGVFSNRRYHRETANALTAFGGFTAPATGIYGLWGAPWESPDRPFGYHSQWDQTWDLLIAPRLTRAVSKGRRLIAEARWRVGVAWGILRHGDTPDF